MRYIDVICCVSSENVFVDMLFESKLDGFNKRNNLKRVINVCL